MIQPSLPPVFLLSGDEPLLMQEAADQIRATAHANGFQQRELIFIENPGDWQKVQHALSHQNLFSEKSLIEIRHENTKADETGIQIIHDYLQNSKKNLNSQADKVIFIITHKLTPALQKTNWHKRIIRPILRHELPAWIKSRLQQAHLTADHDTIQWLAELTAGNLLSAHQAIEKLKLLYPNQTVNKQSLSSVLQDQARFNIFDLVYWVLLGNVAQAVRILRNLQRENQEAILVLWALARECRLLYELAYKKQQQQLISSQPKITVQKALSRLSLNTIRDALIEAGQIDRMIKGLIPGNVWQALERLCLTLAGVGP